MRATLTFLLLLFVGIAGKLFVLQFIAFFFLFAILAKEWGKIYNHCKNNKGL